jgi:DNA topoisomerase-1
VQLGDITKENDKPKRVSIPPQIPYETLSLEKAVELLQLPKVLGQHPGLNKDIKAGLGRFGPFVVCEGDYRSIPKTESIFDVTLARALELFAQPKKGRGRAAPLKEFGPHPVTGDPINLMNGPYGPYLKCGKNNVSLPEGMTPEQVSVEKAIELLADKIGSAKPAKGKKAKKAAPVAKAAVDTVKTKQKAKPVKSPVKTVIARPIKATVGRNLSK